MPVNTSTQRQHKAAVSLNFIIVGGSIAGERDDCRLLGHVITLGRRVSDCLRAEDRRS